jgi:streptogramin lyase
MRSFNVVKVLAKLSLVPRTALLLALVMFVALYAAIRVNGQAAATTPGGSPGGIATISGTVTAPKPFKAAHVYLYNLDKHVMYMVYTNAGAFRAVAMFPGSYELTVRGRGLESQPQKIQIKAGENPPVKVAMSAAADANQYPTSVDPSQARSATGVLAPKQEMTFASYDEIYPPGPGRDVLENLCFNCHGENYFSTRTRSASGWRLGLEHMQGKNLLENDKDRFGGGFLAGAATNFRFGLQDRKDVLDYLTKNFGLDKKPRAVRTDKEWPIDEAALAKAQYIEYYVREQASAAQAAPTTTAASDSEGASGGVAGVRIIMQVQIDAQGNRWAVDRGVPSRLVRLDPRTAEIKAWPLPDRRAGVHEVIIDRKGIVWVPEFSRTPEGKVEGGGSGSDLDSRLLGFNPKTEKWEHAVDLDPNDVIRSKQKGPMMGSTIDSKGRVFVNWMLSGAIGMYDPSTGKADTFRIPTPHAEPYGQTIDPSDNVWVAEWNGGKLGRYNPANGSWTEFAPPGYPANFRRGPESDAEGNIWTGIWAAGKRAGKIARLDPKTGVWTLWDIPIRGSQPYEASIDRDGNIWFPDTSTPDRPMANVRFNPRTQAFTYYPRPQFVADSTRVSHAEDGSVHYTPRYGAAKDTSGFGVLYPDKDKINLAPLMLNGAPGYAFKAAAR